MCILEVGIDCKNPCHSSCELHSTPSDLNDLGPQRGPDTCSSFSADITKSYSSGIGTEHSLSLLDLWVFTQGPVFQPFSLTCVLSAILELGQNLGGFTGKILEDYCVLRLVATPLFGSQENKQGKMINSSELHLSVSHNCKHKRWCDLKKEQHPGSQRFS